MPVNWSEIGRDRLLGRALRLPLMLIPDDITLRIRRGPAKGMKWIAGSFDHGCWLGTYELDKQEALSRLCRPGMCVWDVGAHVGFYSLIAAELVGVDGHVYAVEPFPGNVHRLLDHLRMNELSNVSVIQAALGAEQALAKLTTDGSSAQARFTTGPTALRVPAVTADSLVADGLARPDLMKIDAEGAETAILEGSSQLLNDRHPILFVALHGREQAQGCEKLLRGAGYRLFDLRGQSLETLEAVSEIYAVHDDDPGGK